MRSAFRTILRSPSLVAAEITWRWLFWLCLWLTLGFTFGVVLSNIQVSEANLELLRAMQPVGVAAVVAEIFSALRPVLVHWAPVMIPLFSLLWAVMATVGRIATLKAVRNFGAQTNWLAVFLLNLTRVAVLVGAVAAFLGVGILFGNLVAAHGGTDSVLAGFALLIAGFMLAVIWSILNWFLSLAPIFAVRDGSGWTASVAASVDLCQGQPAAYFSVAGWYSLMRVVLIAGSAIVSMVLMSALNAGAWRAAVPLGAVALVGYLAFADILQLARVLAYLDLAEQSSVDSTAALLNPTAPILPPETFFPASGI